MLPRLGECPALDGKSGQRFGQLTVINGEIDKTTVTSAKNIFVVSENASLFLKNVTLKQYQNKDLIQTNGNQTGVKIAITSCEFLGRCYFPAQGEYIINGGSYTGKCGAFYFKSGTISITSGYFSSTSYDGDWGHYENGAMFIGCAIIIEACDYGAHGAPIVHITGGQFYGSTPLYGLLVIDYKASNKNTTN